MIADPITEYLIERTVNFVFLIVGSKPKDEIAILYTYHVNCNLTVKIWDKIDTKIQLKSCNKEHAITIIIFPILVKIMKRIWGNF